MLHVDEDHHPHRPPVHPVVRFAVERRVTMGMLVVGVLVLGALSLTRLPLEYLPAISSSSVWVSAPYQGSSPEESMRSIVRPLEDSLGTLNGLDRMSSNASANEASVSLEFVPGSDMDLAAVEVRDRVDRVRHRLPDDLQQVRIRRFQSSDLPVLRAHVTSEWPRDQLYRFAEDVLQQRLERLEGVAQADIRGLRTRELQIRLDADRMAAHGIDARQLNLRLRANNVNVTGGTIVEGSRELLVRVLGELATVQEIRRLPIDDDGLRLEDVAEVVYDYPEQTSYNFLNGSESLSIRVYKASNANLLEVTDRAKAVLAELEDDPQYAGLSTRIYSDSSVDVRKGLSKLRDAGLIGGLLAVMAVFLFLRRLRTTLLVAIAIPVSVVFTFVLIYLLREAGWSNMTLNVVSLMGLVLALGMLVDSSIVVIESIYRRAQDLGEDPATAAMRGASEVAMPILASTATTLCVFLPVIFLRGGSGFFSRYLTEVGLTVCIVMVASLIVALTVVPMAAAMLLRSEGPARAPLLDRLASVYAKVLNVTLHYRLVFVVIAAVALYGSWVLFGSIERTFASRGEARQISVNVDTPRAYTVEQTAALFQDLFQRIDARRDQLDIADITHSYDTRGGRSRSFRRGKRIELYLNDEDQATLTTAEVRDKVRELLPVEAGVSLRIGQSRRHWGGGLEVELAGEDPTVLELLSREVAQRIAQVPGVEDVDLSLESGDDEIRVAVDRTRALQAGLSSDVVAATVQGALSDRSLAQLKTENGEVEVVMQYREEDRQTLTQLRNVQVRAGDDASSARVPLDTVASFEQTAGPMSIEREDRRSKLEITANASSPMASMMAMRGIGAVMGSIAMPPGYSWSFGRWNRLQQEDQKGSSFTLLFAALMVYMLMAALFESFTHPFAIMASVPFAFLGVGVVMKLAGQPRDNLTELGFIILLGVVVNNAIILVDHINRLRREGLDRDQAILLGGRHRLRPILMTAVTTILGLLPMVAPIFFPQWFGSVEGRAGNWAPVGLVILGGLTTSTFLTLVIIPTVYSLVDDLATFVKRVAQSA